MVTASKAEHGLWIDDTARYLMLDSYWESFHELGFDAAAFMLESTTKGFDPRYSLDLMKAIGDRLEARKVELVLTIWPEPSDRYVAELAEKLPPIIQASGAKAIEFDTEWNWLESKLIGYHTMDQAADALLGVFKGCASSGIRKETTTYAYHAENSKRAVLADNCDVTLAQAYSVRNREDAAHNGKWKVPWTDTLGPGRMQKLTLDRSLTVPKTNGKPEIGCGLAAYDQVWPGRTGEAAMQTAYDMALTYDPVALRWWSSKWVIGAHKNSYAVRFFKSLQLSTRPSLR